MKVLAATDGSENAERAIKFACRLAQAEKSQLTIVHVVPELPTTKREIIELISKTLGEQNDAGRKYLEHGRKIASKFGVKPSLKLLKGNPAEELLKEIERGKYGLVVVGSRGRGRLNELLLGSVSSKLVHLARASVLVVR